jgi:hypothetical protein
MGVEIPLRAWLAGTLSRVASDALEVPPSRWFARVLLRGLLLQQRTKVAVRTLVRTRLHAPAMRR